MEGPYQMLIFNFVEAAVKSLVAGCILSLALFEIKKLWVKKKRWKLGLTLGSLIFAFYIIFAGLIL